MPEDLVTIGKGTTWGVPGPLPPGAPVTSTDQALRRLVVDHMERGAPRPLPAVGLAGGTLWRTVGGPAVPNRLHTAEAMHLPVDVIEAVIDGRTTWFVSRLVAHDLLRRRWLVAMNAQFHGRHQLGPRAHPGDGLLDVFQATLAPAELMKVALRARNGAHLPHPGITERRAAQHAVTLHRPMAVWLDGQRVARARTVRLTVLPDALTVVV